jgi:hypothetical protein
MPLDGPVREQLDLALRDAFDQDSLARMLRYRLSEKEAHDAVKLTDPMPKVVFELVNEAERAGWTLELITQAHRFVPKNAALRQFCERHAPTALAATDPSDGARTVEEGIRGLVRLMDNSAIRDSAVEFRTIFRGSRDNIEELARYKKLHDGLHSLQLIRVSFMERYLRAGAGPPDDQPAPAGPEALLELQTCEFDLRRLEEDLAGPAQKVATAAREARWLKQAHEVTRLVQRGSEQADLTVLVEAASIIDSVLPTEFSRIYGLLRLAFRQLRLGELVRTMKRICDKAEASGQAPADLGRYRASLQRLEGVDRDLAELIDDHDKWQEIDNALRAQANGWRAPGGAPPQWEGTQEMLLDQCNRSGEDWAKQLAGAVGRLEAAVQGGQPGADLFKLVRHMAIRRFYYVDKQLDNLCAELRRIGEPLNAVWEVLTNQPAEA